MEYELFPHSSTSTGPPKLTLEVGLAGRGQICQKKFGHSRNLAGRPPKIWVNSFGLPTDLWRQFSGVLPLQCFAVIIVRIRDPKMALLIFASGKMVGTGAKSEDDSSLVSCKYARVIQNLGFDTEFLEFGVQNNVGG